MDQSLVSSQYIFHKITYPLTKYIYKKSDALVVYGYHVKDYLINLGVDENKIFYSWNVIDNSLFKGRVNNEEVAKIKKNYNLNYKYILLFVGRHSEEKGLIYLLDAVKLLPKDLSVGLNINW